MNKLVLLSVFLVGLISSLFSQNYIPFPTSNASWIDSENCQENHYQISGDTVINGNTFHKLNMTYKYYQMDQWGDCDYYSYRIQSYPYQYIGSFRNDSAAKKVYFLPKDSTNEKLLYDFNYSLGDTLRPTYSRSYNFNHPNPLVVTKVDSILILGIYHRTIGFISCPTSYFGSSDTLQLIEGIGSNSGLFSSYNICNYYVRASRLYCHRQNGQIVFSDTYGNCNLISSIENAVIDKSTISVSPNPAHNFVKVKSDGNIKGISIYDIAGKQLSFIENPGQSSSLDVSGFQSGIYLIRFQLEDGKIVAKKLIIQ